MFAPGAIAGLLMMHRPLIRAKTLGNGDPILSGRGDPDAGAGYRRTLAIETVARYTDSQGEGNVINLFGIPLDATKPTTWLIAIILIVRRLSRCPPHLATYR